MIDEENKVSNIKPIISRIILHVCGFYIIFTSRIFDHYVPNRRILYVNELYVFSRKHLTNTVKCVIMAFLIYYSCIGGKKRYFNSRKNGEKIKKCMIEKKHIALNYIMDSINYYLMYICSRHLSFKENEKYEDLKNRAWKISYRYMERFNDATYTSLASAMMKSHNYIEFDYFLIEQMENRIKDIEQLSKYLPNSIVLKFLIKNYKRIVLETIVVIKLRPKKITT